MRGPYQWNGGSVTLRLHEGRLDGEPIYYVRTDASDQAFAEQQGLVWVPVLRLPESDRGAQRLRSHRLTKTPAPGVGGPGRDPARLR